MKFWSFTNFHKTFLDQSIWIYKWMSSWCHHLTTCHIFCTYNFEYFKILPKLVIVWPSYQDILELTIFCIYSEGNKGKSNILIAEIWNFCHFFVQNEWKIVRRWHQLTHLHIHIDWSRIVSWKFAKLQSVITSLLFNRFSSGFHYFVLNILLFLLRLSETCSGFPL